MLGDRWGVRDDEVARHYPCDDLVPAPSVQLWRGVTVHAPVDQVWPWLCQVQLAPYSYDWIDNLGKQSPRELVDHPDPKPGEHFSMSGNRFKLGRTLAVEHGVHLTATTMGAVMSYVLVPEGQDTRLLLKIVVSGSRLWARPLGLGDWVMARRQLLNLKERAETACRGC